MNIEPESDKDLQATAVHDFDCCGRKVALLSNENVVDYPDYSTYTMQDCENDDLLLVHMDYLAGRFDLEVQNEQGKPIVITLRERLR